MRTKFFTICCIAAVAGWIFPCEAKLKEVSSFEENNVMRQENAAPMPRNIPNPLEKINSKSAFQNYLKNRMKSVLITKYDNTSASHGDTASSVMEDKLPENINEEKSTFQKIYEDAIKRIEAEDTQAPTPAIFPNENDDAKIVPEEKMPLDTIDVLLPPFNERVRVPAFEHIPYLFSQIEVLPDGQLKIEETIITIANGQKLKTPLVLAVPDLSVSRTGEAHRTDIGLVSVLINNMPVEYVVEKQGGSTLLMPKENFRLENGVYKYVFTFVVDRQLWRYDDFDELYWDVSGSSWNLVITRSGASVTLPEGVEPVSNIAVTGYPGRLTADNIVITKDADNVIGFVNKTPLFLAEGMYLNIEIPKGAIAQPSVSKQINWMIADYGDIVFSLAGLLIIIGSYLLSWKYIQKNMPKSGVGLKKTPMMLRFLAKGVFDRIGFGAFLLDLYRKSIIDLQKNDNSILLVKRTDNLKSLNKNEQKAVYELFGRKDAVLRIGSENMLKFKRAYKFAAQDLKSKFNLFSLKLNAGYLTFSIGMVILTEIFISLLYIDSINVFFSLFLSSISFGFYLVLFSIRWNNKWVNFTVKFVSLFFMVLTYIIFCAKISMLAALFIVGSLTAIMVFSKLYTKRSGLLKGNIQDAQNFAAYLIQNRENISLGKDFLNQQANIFALEVDAYYKDNSNIKDYYKLEIMKEIVKQF